MKDLNERHRPRKEGYSGLLLNSNEKTNRFSNLAPKTQDYLRDSASVLGPRGLGYRVQVTGSGCRASHAWLFRRLSGERCRCQRSKPLYTVSTTRAIEENPDTIDWIWYEEAHYCSCHHPNKVSTFGFTCRHFVNDLGLSCREGHSLNPGSFS